MYDFKLKKQLHNHIFKNDKAHLKSNNTIRQSLLLHKKKIIMFLPILSTSTPHNYMCIRTSMCTISNMIENDFL